MDLIRTGVPLICFENKPKTWVGLRIPNVCQIIKQQSTGSVQMMFVRLSLRKPGAQFDPSRKICRLCAKEFGIRDPSRVCQIVNHINIHSLSYLPQLADDVLACDTISC